MDKYQMLDTKVEVMDEVRKIIFDFKMEIVKGLGFNSAYDAIDLLEIKIHSAHLNMIKNAFV